MQRILVLASLLTLSSCSVSRSTQKQIQTDSVRMALHHQQTEQSQTRTDGQEDEYIELTDQYIPNPLDTLLPPLHRQIYHRQHRQRGVHEHRLSGEATDSVGHQHLSRSTYDQHESQTSLSIWRWLWVGAWSFIIGVIITIVVMIRNYRP